MNLLLLLPDDFIATKRVQIGGRRLAHISEIIKAKPGDTLKAGMLNELIGTATLVHIDSTMAILDVALDNAAPPPSPITLVLALPRPKMLRRILQATTMLGIKHLHLIGSWRVEKSYWQSPFLEPDKIHEQLILGLEQAIDTQLPEVHLHPLFKPFVEDKLDVIAGESLRLVAHPSAKLVAPCRSTKPMTLVIGPEGGFIPYEIEKFEAIGFQTVTLGPRILNVEVAVTTLINQLGSVNQ